jgi:hypothetical protein
MSSHLLIVVIIICIPLQRNVAVHAYTGAPIAKAEVNMDIDAETMETAIDFYTEDESEFFPDRMQLPEAPILSQVIIYAQCPIGHVRTVPISYRKTEKDSIYQMPLSSLLFCLSVLLVSYSSSRSGAGQLGAL